MRGIYLRRTARNLAVSAIVLAFLWALKGFPLPAEADFRRCERQALAERSEIVWTHEGTTLGDDDLLVGLADRFVHVWHPNGYVLFWPRQDGGTLVHLPAKTRYQDQGSSYLSPALLVPDPPVEAVQARLTITLSINDWMEDYTVEGERQGQAFFFQLRMRHHNEIAGHATDEETAFQLLTSERPESAGGSGYPYTLEFFDASGNLLSTIHQEGWLAEEDA